MKMTEKPDLTKKYVKQSRRTINNNIQAGQVPAEQPVDTIKKAERPPPNPPQNQT